MTKPMSPAETNWNLCPFNDQIDLENIRKTAKANEIKSIETTNAFKRYGLPTEYEFVHAFLSILERSENSPLRTLSAFGIFNLFVDDPTYQKVYLDIIEKELLEGRICTGVIAILFNGFVKNLERYHQVCRANPWVAMAAQQLNSVNRNTGEPDASSIEANNHKSPFGKNQG